MSDSEAYRILTREWTNMHHTERTALDKLRALPVILKAVKDGKSVAAVTLVKPLRTEKGDAWRAKQEKIFSELA